jgi:hypothetical protein
MLQGSLLAAALAVGVSSVVAAPLAKRDATTSIVKTTPYGNYGICIETPTTTVRDNFWPLNFVTDGTVEDCLLKVRCIISFSSSFLAHASFFLPQVCPSTRDQRPLLYVPSSVLSPRDRGLTSIFPSQSLVATVTYAAVSTLPSPALDFRPTSASSAECTTNNALATLALETVPRSAVDPTTSLVRLAPYPPTLSTF